MIDLIPSIYLALVLAIGVFAQWLAWRFKLPAIVLLLFMGIGFGVLVGGPEGYLGETESGTSVLFPMVSLAVGVILFEGGLNLQFREVQSTGGVVIRLVTVGVVITGILATIAAHYLVGFSWPMSALLGSVLTVSGPTVILPLLRQVQPPRQLGSIVKWEGIVNDPIGAMIAALVFEAVNHGADADIAGGPLLGIVETVAVGAIMGLTAAWLVVQTIRHYLIPDFLENASILGLVVLVFSFSNYLQPESGLLTVTVMGIALANQRVVPIKHVIEFKENLRVLLLSVLFIVLGSRVDLSMEQVRQVGWGGLAFVACLILVIRPIMALISTWGSDISREERVFLAWIHPRGIVAAAVATLFALELSKNRADLAEEAELMVLIIFLVVLGTVSVYGVTLGPLARRLRLSREDPQGILFAGASPVVRAIAQSIREEGFGTLLVDTNPQNIAAARMAGLPVCYASIGSEYVQQETDLVELGRLLAMTPNDEVNTLAVNEFAGQFGRASVYQLAPDDKPNERHKRVPEHLRGRILFGPGVTKEGLSQLFSDGARIKKNTLSDDYTYEDFRQMYGRSAIVLFVIPEKGKLVVRTADTRYEPKRGDRLIALVPPADDQANQSHPTELTSDEDGSSDDSQLGGA